MSPARTNLLDEAAYIEGTHQDNPEAVSRYGAFVLGRALGHAMAADPDDGPRWSVTGLWAVYGPLAYAATCGALGRHLSRVLAAAEVIRREAARAADDRAPA